MSAVSGRNIFSEGFGREKRPLTVGELFHNLSIHGLTFYAHDNVTQATICGQSFVRNYFGRNINPAAELQIHLPMVPQPSDYEPAMMELHHERCMDGGWSLLGGRRSC